MIFRSFFLKTSNWNRVWQSSLLGWWGGRRLDIEKRWLSGARVLRTPCSSSFREAEYELDLPASAGDGPERLWSFSLSRLPGKVAGKHAGRDPPARFDQRSSQNVYGRMKHLVFDDIGALPRKRRVQKPPACSQTSGARGMLSTFLVAMSVRTSSSEDLSWAGGLLAKVVAVTFAQHSCPSLAINVWGRAPHPQGLTGAAGVTGGCWQLWVKAEWEISCVNTARGEWILFI